MVQARQVLFDVQGSRCATYAIIRMDITMRFVPLFIFCSLMYGWGTLAPTEAQLPWDRQLPQVPEVKAQMVVPPLAVGASGPTTLRLAVEIPPNHHGYLDAGDDGLLIPLAFTFPALVERGVQIVILSHPAGVRDVQVRATVLRGAGEFVFRLDTQGATLSTADPLPALLRYQICHDVTKVCYPPQDREVPLHFASVAGREAPTTPIAQTASRPAASLTMSERVTTLFQRSRQHVPLALVVVFAAGLLASATPCVYPLLPVTSAILLARGRGSRRRGLWHTAVYCLGIVFFYAVLGWFAATTGTALSIVMTKPGSTSASPSSLPISVSVCWGCVSSRSCHPWPHTLSRPRASAAGWRGLSSWGPPQGSVSHPVLVRWLAPFYWRLPGKLPGPVGRALW